MKYFLLAGAIGVIMSCGNGKNSASSSPDGMGKDSVPACVRKTLDELAKQEPPMLPLEVNEYIYNGKTTYLFTADCCDHFNLLYDENCKVICAPSGGFTGKGDGKCADFDKTAKLVRMIWRKPGKQ